jgi:hypothetical protein
LKYPNGLGDEIFFAKITRKISGDEGMCIHYPDKSFNSHGCAEKFARELYEYALNIKMISGCYFGRGVVPFPEP